LVSRNGRPSPWHCRRLARSTEPDSECPSGSPGVTVTVHGSRWPGDAGPPRAARPPGRPHQVSVTAGSAGPATSGSPSQPGGPVYTGIPAPGPAGEPAAGPLSPSHQGALMTRTVATREGGRRPSGARSPDRQSASPSHRVQVHGSRWPGGAKGGRPPAPLPGSAPAVPGQPLAGSERARAHGFREIVRARGARPKYNFPATAGPMREEAAKLVLLPLHALKCPAAASGLVLP
jgi:hypothetical protein